MSRYIDALNAIKTNLSRLELTPSQVACQLRIEERLAYPGVVNLYGLPGVGKTVLGWAMGAAAETTYVVHGSPWLLGDMRQARIAFLDNAASDRSSFRRLSAMLESAGVDRAVVATRAPVDDYVFRAELELTAGDIAVARQGLAELGYQASEQEYANLWHLLVGIAREG